jgi:hypothetical protein
MFSGDQVEKIKYFATITKITNECFKKCVNLNLNHYEYDLNNLINE